MLKPFPMCFPTPKTYRRMEFRLKLQFQVIFHVCKNLTMKMYMFQMACTYLPVMENERYYYIYIVKTIYSITNGQKLVRRGFWTRYDPSYVFLGYPKNEEICKHFNKS